MSSPYQPYDPNGPTAPQWWSQYQVAQPQTNQASFNDIPGMTAPYSSGAGGKTGGTSPTYNPGGDVMSLPSGAGRPQWWNDQKLQLAGGAGGEEVTTSIPGGSSVANPTAASMPWLAEAAEQAKTGTGQSGQEQVAGAPKVELAGTNAPARVDAQGNYILPTGEVLPGSAAFTLNIGGNQVKVPGYYEVNNNKLFNYAQGSATAMEWFSRRMNDARNRGENVNDPNVQYRELARLRDDTMAALGLKADDPQLAAKLRAATGFVHLDRFVRGANGETGYTPAPGAGSPGTGQPAPTTPPPAAPPAETPPAETPPGEPPPVVSNGNPGSGKAKFRETEIEAALTDPDLAYNLYKSYTKGNVRSGTGPFSRYFDQRMEPIIMAALNAAGAGGKKLSVGDVEQLFTQIQEAVKSGGMGKMLGGMAQNFMGGATGDTTGEDYDAMRNTAQMLTPLTSFGLNPIYNNTFMRGQRNTFADLYDQANASNNFGDDINDWGARLRNSQWYQRWYGQQ